MPEMPRSAARHRGHAAPALAFAAGGGWSASVDRDGLKLDEEEAFAAASGAAGILSLAANLASLVDGMHLEALPLESFKQLDAAEFQEMWRIPPPSSPSPVSDGRRCSPKKDCLIRPTVMAGSSAPMPRACRRAWLAASPDRRRLDGVDRRDGGAPCRDRRAAERCRRAARPRPGPGCPLLVAAGWRRPRPSHPQYALRRLLDHIGVGPDEVAEIGAPSPALAARARLFTEAMRPATTTDAWRRLATVPSPRRRCPFGDHGHRGAGRAREALAIALVLREAIEQPGRSPR